MRSKKRLLFIFISFIGIVVISCHSQCKEEIEFKKFYFEKIDKIVNYDKNMSTNGYAFTEDYWFSFYETSGYLEVLTKQKFRYVVGEPPLYRKKSDLKADVQDLKNWYQENKCGMTKEKADSIVNARDEQMRDKRDR